MKLMDLFVREDKTPTFLGDCVALIIGLGFLLIAWLFVPIYLMLSYPFKSSMRVTYDPKNEFRDKL